MKKHLFNSLRKQLVYEIFFVANVGKPYRDEKKELEIFDFEYKSKPHQLVLNGHIMLKNGTREVEVVSFQDLVRGLLRLNR